MTIHVLRQLSLYSGASFIQIVLVEGEVKFEVRFEQMWVLFPKP